MKKRLTFIHQAGSAIDPSSVHLENDTLHLSLKAAREDRLTFSLYELPQEVINLQHQTIVIVITELA